MNAAELRCLREGLGLTIKWMAAYLGVSERHYRHMEDDRDREGHLVVIQADQVAMVRELWRWTQSRVQEEILAAVEAGEPERLRWLIYRTDAQAEADGLESAPSGPTLTAAWHRSVMLQAQTVLGGPIQYFDADALDAAAVAQVDTGATITSTEDGGA